MRYRTLSRLAFIVFASSWLTLLGAASAQTPGAGEAQGKPKPRSILIALKTGEQLRGDLVKVDTEVVEFTVRNILQAVDLDEVKSISFPDKPAAASGRVIPAIPDRSDSAAHRREPYIVYKEKAKYTGEARKNNISGVVILSAVFVADGRIAGIRAVQGLPYGLTESAIEAAKRIRFQPATENGSLVNMRSTLEFNFSPTQSTLEFKFSPY